MNAALMDFFFPQELGRLSYLWRVVLFNGAACYLSGNGAAWESGRWDSDAWAALGLAVYSIFFIIWPRMRDAHMRGWLLVLAFIPYVDHAFSLLLMFRPSWTPLDTPSRVPPDEPHDTPRVDSPAEHMLG